MSTLTNLLKKSNLVTKHNYSTTSSIASQLQAWQADLIRKGPTTTHDELSASQLNLLSNTLSYGPYLNENTPKQGTIIPPCWHHVYFPPRTQEPDLALDGYEKDFFPPKPFSQRMWVGAQLNWSKENPLKIGQKVEMKTRIDRAELRNGRMGDSAMVWINKDIENEKGWSMREQRCLVYHPEQTKIIGTNRGIEVRKESDFSVNIVPSSILLFRYSALTFNSHKIHFDHDYATQVEKHPACLVHGPLSGTLLLDFLRKQVKENDFIKSFEYKCLTPLYVNQTMTLAGRKSKEGDRYELWITNHLGHLAVKGSVMLYALDQ